MSFPYLEETQPLLAQALCLIIFGVQLFFLMKPLKPKHQWTIQTLLLVLAANISSVAALMNLLLPLIFCFVLLHTWIQSSVACILFTAYVVTPRYAAIVPRLWEKALATGLLSKALWNQSFYFAIAWIVLGSASFYLLKKSVTKKRKESDIRDSHHLLVLSLGVLGIFYVPAIAPLAFSLAPFAFKKKA